jgi:hypothetical protein
MLGRPAVAGNESATFSVCPGAPRLPSLLQPAVLDSELLDPSALSKVREETRNLLAGQARAEQGMRKEILESAAVNLSNAMNLDDEVRRALAALLKA